jgi:hypothetical protein
MPWESVNQIPLPPRAVPTPLFAADVHRPSMPGPPGACRSSTGSSYPPCANSGSSVIPPSTNTVHPVT